MTGSIPWNKGITAQDDKRIRAGKNHPFYTGEEHLRRGYIFVNKIGHPRGYRGRNAVMRCILVVEKKLGRYITPQEIVHHINGIRTDDRLKNLYVFKDKSAHISYHRNLQITYEKWIQSEINRENTDKTA